MPRLQAVSDLEETLAWEMRAVGLPDPVREFRFHLVRKWLFDFAWPALKIACEVEGGIASRGHHVRPAGYESDCEKYSEAAILGWKVLRVTAKMIADGRALALVERVFGGGDAKA